MSEKSLPADPTAGTRSYTWPRFLGTVLVLLAAIAVPVAVAVTISPYQPDSDPDGYVASLFVGTGVGELLALGMLVLLLRRRGMGLTDLGLWRRTTVVAVAAGLLLGAAYAAATAWTVPGVIENAAKPSWLKLLAVVVTVLVAGTVEETIFRGFVMTAVQSLGRGRVLQVLFAGVTYSVAHPSGGAEMLFTLGLGAGLGVVYLLGKRSLTPVILAHMLVNLIIEPGLYLSIAASFGG